MSKIRDAAEALTASRQIRESMGKAARRGTAGEFIWEKRVLKVLEWYRQVLAETRGANVKGDSE